MISSNNPMPSPSAERPPGKKGLAQDSTITGHPAREETPSQNG